MARVSSKTKEATTAVEKEVAVATKEIPKRKFENSDPIRCVSVTAGELIMIGNKTKNVYVWSGYGDDTVYVEYQDLLSAKLTKSQYVFSPLFVIDDEDIVNEWKDVAAIYNKMVDAREIAELFSLDNTTFKRTILNLPIGLKNALKTMVYDMVENGSLDSLGKIKIIDEVLGTDIMSMIRG